MSIVSNFENFQRFWIFFYFKFELLFLLILFNFIWFFIWFLILFILLFLLLIFFLILIGNSEIFFRIFCEMFLAIQKGISNKFPEQTLPLVLDFIFFKYICTAIINPKKYRLLDGNYNLILTFLSIFSYF